MTLTKTIGNQLAQYLAKRAIDLEVAEKAGLYSARHTDQGLIPDPNGDLVVLPYAKGAKYRNIHTGQWFQTKGGNKTMWLREFCEDCNQIIITEGEWDALAAMTAGLTGVMSIPEGAPSETGRKAYPAIDDAAELLAAADRIILAVDNDEAGSALFEDLVRVIGKAKCAFVEYPDDCKDLNDVLVRHGEDAVHEVIASAKLIPVTGLYKPDEVPDLGLGRVYKAYLGDEFDRHVGLCKKQISIWTGYANMGKSVLVKNILMNLAKQGENIAVCAFEDDISRNYKLDMLKIYAGEHESRVTTEQREQFENLYQDRFVFISTDATDDLPTMPWLLERIEIAANRYRSDFVVIDPWTELVKDRRENVIDHIERGLNELKAAARYYNIHIMIVAHPRKPGVDGADAKVPTGYDISGSAHFANKAFNGVTLHRTAIENLVSITVWKTKRQEMGRNGTFYMRYDPLSGRLLSLKSGAGEALLAA
ncbi:MAG: toprim domain-containing protein [Pseudomonadota bacterium]